jgi:hypothetical protein
MTRCDQLCRLTNTATDAIVRTVGGALCVEQGQLRAINAIN